MTRWLRAATGGVILCLLMQLLGFVGACEELRDSTVRLHVLAHSDSDADQALKLKVRDAVTAAAADLLADTDSHDEALAVLEASLPTLTATAQQTVYAAGYTYPVRAELTEMYFTTREYDSGTFPAGTYDALRVSIGDAKGRNWWCVVYPPLCVSAATKPDTTATPLTDRQTKVTKTPKYAVRFKFVEWLTSLFG